MPTAAHRAPLLLSLVIALGVGGRFWREHSVAVHPDAIARTALDSQLQRVEQAGGRSKSTRSRGAGASRKSAKRRVAGDSTSGSNSSSSAKRSRSRLGGVSAGGAPSSGGVGVVRSERTPAGAIAPEVLEKRARDSTRAARRASSGSRSTRVARPGKSGREEKPLVDLESASAAEIETLPLIGPALAERIVEDRAKRGAFGSIEGLQRVRGVGPAMVLRLRGKVTFGGTGRP